jgi:hypothetical protein
MFMLMLLGEAHSGLLTSLLSGMVRALPSRPRSSYFHSFLPYRFSAILITFTQQFGYILSDHVRLPCLYGSLSYFLYLCNTAGYPTIPKVQL